MHCCDARTATGCKVLCQLTTLPEHPAASSYARLDVAAWMTEPLPANTSVTMSDVPAAHQALLRTPAGHTAPTEKIPSFSTVKFTGMSLAELQ
jgi:hypothetical protein